jgi:hypothetical protein
MGRYIGEGFSIVALQCTLIEFLESTLIGKNYRFLKKGQVLGEHEYSSSSALFVDFLSKRKPFAETFDAQSALDFYVGVRCGLLHEAQTKNDWTIWAKPPDGKKISDTKKRIVYRDALQDALVRYISAYGNSLATDGERQAAFLRKFDRLAGLT